MSEYTHVFYEAGNGFPNIGDEVLVEDDYGWNKIKRVASISSIHTRQWSANWVYLTLGDEDRVYDDLSDDDAETAWFDLHHVKEIEVEESARAG